MQFKDTLRSLILTACSCLLVFSCITVDKTIGSDLVPDDYKLKMESVSLPLPVTVKQLDSMQGISSSYYTIGSIRTEEFGTARFGTAGNIAPSSTALDLGEDPRIISVYLQIPLAVVADAASLDRASIIMDPSQYGITQNINVYRLKRQIDSTTLYANSLTENDYTPELLNANGGTYFGGDTLKVYLSNEFGTEILSATSEELDSLDLFSERFPGLYVTCDDPVGNAAGGRLNLFDGTNSFVFVKYNFQPTYDKTLPRKDTTIALAFGYGYALNTAEYDSADMQTGELLEKIPVEGMGGLAPFVDYKALKELLDGWAEQNNIDPSKVMVAKASVVFPFELPENLDLVPYQYPSYLFPTNRKPVSDTTDAIYYYLLEDYNSTDNPLGVMNRSLMNYTSDVSGYIQKMINKDLSDLNDTYSFWMYPLRTETDSYYGTTYYYINNFSYYKAMLNGPKAERYPELKLVYAVLE